MVWENEKDSLEKLLITENKSYTEVGKLYGCCGNNIKKVARKLGINVGPKRKINSSEIVKRKRDNDYWKNERDNIYNLISNGYNNVQISEKYNVGIDKIRNVIKKLGITIPIKKDNLVLRENMPEFTPKQLGNIGESKVISAFIENNVPVYIPFGDNEKADIVAEFNGKLNKIQVKSSYEFKDGYFSVHLISNTRTKKYKQYIHEYTKDEVDYFALYNYQSDILLLIPIEDLRGKKMVYVRIPFKRSRNQQMVINYENYTFDKILKENM